MAPMRPEPKEPRRFARRRARLITAAVVLVGFLGWYDAMRNQGRLFICDLAALAGQAGALALCREAGTGVDN